MSFIPCNDVVMQVGYTGPWSCDICTVKKGEQHEVSDNGACSFCGMMFSCCDECKSSQQPPGKRLCHLPHRELPDDIWQFAAIPKNSHVALACTLQELVKDAEEGELPPYIFEAAKNGVDACVVVVGVDPAKMPHRFLVLRKTYDNFVGDKPAPPAMTQEEFGAMIDAQFAAELAAQM